VYIYVVKSINHFTRIQQMYCQMEVMGMYRHFQSQSK
jgi:hypothetical protein